MKFLKKLLAIFLPLVFKKSNDDGLKFVPPEKLDEREKKMMEELKKIKLE